MKLPWVSRALYDMALAQIEDLKKANAQLMDLALTKQASPASTEDVEEMATKPQRRLVKTLRGIAEQEMLERFQASKKTN